MRLLSVLLSIIPASGFIDDLLNPNSNLRSAIELLVAIFAIVGGGVTAFVFIKSIWRRIFSPYCKYRSFVDSVYSKEIRKSISKCYIPTRAQDIDPCEFEEIRENNGNYFTQPLIPFFRQKAFKVSSQGKYYLVLADSGMGKTTFMLRLYRECLFDRSLQKRLSIKLIPLSQDNCIQSIVKTDNQENTILLLDALDENREALKDYEYFFTKLIKVSGRFNKVIITCRTQFFPNRASEPAETGRIRVGTGNKAEEIIKKYISPFSDEEVTQYLRKQFRFNKKKQRQAFEIVTKVPVLMARPVILNWITFLCDSLDDFSYSYQIYTAIINKWIERESLSRTDRRLFDLSCEIADYMCKNNTTSMSAEMVEEIALRKNIQLAPIIAKSRSLLNRNGNGEYKFAHKSFLEYFIVRGIFEKMEMPQNLAFLFSHTGVKRFFEEILLDSAQKTNPTAYQKTILLFSQLRPYIKMESIFDIFNHKKVSYVTKSTTDGFTICANLRFMASELHDPNNVVLVCPNMFVDASEKNKIKLKRQTISIFELYISVERNTPYPDTTIEISSNILR